MAEPRDAAAIVAAARACIGARFRLHGRDRVGGLDCVGLAAQAFGVIALPAGYALRGGDRATIARVVQAAGLSAIEVEEAGAGSLLLVVPGPAQFHLIVLTEAGFVHAHAGIGRVVETPGPPPWPRIAAWRLDIKENSSWQPWC